MTGCRIQGALCAKRSLCRRVGVRVKEDREVEAAETGAIDGEHYIHYHVTI